MPSQFPWQFGSALPWLDLFGIAVFAITGALAAIRHRQTLVTATFFALITGVGGGSVRDLLIGAPVFWVHDRFVAGICLAVAVLVWTTPERWWKGTALDWLDAVGLAAYAVFGAAKALAFGIPPVPAALMGVVTACIGGVIRDVLAGEPSILMRPELYVTAAALFIPGTAKLVRAPSADAIVSAEEVCTAAAPSCSVRRVVTIWFLAFTS